MSGKYFLQSGLRVLELLVKMDIVYEDKDKIILNKPVAGDGKYGGNMAVQVAERIKGIRIKRGCIALCAVSLKVDGKLYEVKPGFYFCIYVSNELISALAHENLVTVAMIYFYLSLSFISISLVSVDS